jgi:transcriptional regulator with XRE-family HTH domain
MDEPQLVSIGPLMKAARKFKKFNQSDVASAIGCSQSALSKMEHNLLVPSAPQWFLFARFTSIPPETIETGVIDRHFKIKFNDDQVSLGFKIPKKYRNFRSEKVREIYPFLQYLEKTMGPSKVEEFILTTGLDAEFFIDFDNLINFQLLVDVIDYFVKMGKTSKTEIDEIVTLGQNDIYWNHYGIEWKNFDKVEEVFEAFAREQVFFQSDFQIKVETHADKITVSYFPEYHLKNMSDNLFKETIDFLNLYRESSLENLIQRVLNKKIKVELIPEVSASPLAARFQILPMAA